MTNLSETLSNSTTAMEWCANAVKKLSLQSHTAFEVYAHKDAIPVGNNNALGEISVELPANMMTQKVAIRSSVPDLTKCDVIIDWGDGKTSIVAKGNYDQATDVDADGERIIFINHTYEADGKYIVRIFGTDYFGFNKRKIEPEYNLICRIFDWDLPVANHITNLADFCANCHQLVNVHIASYKFLEQAGNHYGMFRNCVNLKSCTGIGEHIPPTRSVQAFFLGCANLVETDFVFPLMFHSIRDVFEGCSKLAVNIETLFHSWARFVSRDVNFRKVFKGCASLTGTVPVERLWGDTGVNWWEHGEVFTGCSDAIRAQVPVSWGGTKQD